MLKDFKEFALRGSVIDMAVGIIIGAAFSGIVTSLVNDVLMPPIGLLLGKTDFSNLYLVLKEGSIAGPYSTLADAKKAGAVTVNIGIFLNTIVNFLILSFCIFMFVRSINTFRRKEETQCVEQTTKSCPFCYSTIPVKAIRCPHCTADIKI
jgi:large conductance mechanosensitive channel